MLIKTIEEVRAVANIPLALGLESLKADIEEAEIKYLVPCLGLDLYETLEVIYQGDEIELEANARLKKILTHCQRVVCNLAIAEAIDFLQVQISESGVQRVEKADEKSAYHYQKLEAQDYYARKGYTGVERLLLVLETAPDTYAEWKSSSAYTRRKEMFVPDAATFHQYYQIDESRRTYLALMPIMKRVEQFKIRETIGEALYSAMKAELIHTSEPVKAEHKKLLSDFIQPAVCNLTVAISAHELEMNVTPVGVVISNRLAIGSASQEKKTAPSDKLDLLYTRANGVGESYLKKLKSYLIGVSSETLYPQFFNSSLYPKDQAEEKPKGKIYGAL